MKPLADFLWLLAALVVGAIGWLTLAAFAAFISFVLSTT